jgi:hypothetical protein
MCRDAETAALARLSLDGGTMSVGYRADDGQPESVAIWMCCPPVGEPLERLEKPVDLILRYNRSGVEDIKTGLLANCLGHDIQAASGSIVEYRIVDQVGHHALSQVRVA